MKKSTKEETPEQRQTLSGASAIQALAAKPLVIKFAFGSQDCELSGRYLLPFEVEILRLLLDEVGAPPIVKGSNPNPASVAEMYDWAHPEFQKKKTKAERFVRALAVFYAVEEIQQLMLAEAEKDSPESLAKGKIVVADRYKASSHEFIVNWMHHHFVDEILEAIYTQVRQAPISVPKAVNFS